MPGRRNVCLIENPLEYKANKWRLTGDGVRRLVRDKSPSVKAHKWGRSLLTPPKWRPNNFRSKSAARCEKSVQNAGRLQEKSTSMVQNRPNAMACRNRSRESHPLERQHPRVDERNYYDPSAMEHRTSGQTRSSQNNNFCTCQSPQRKLNDLLITATAESKV